VTGVDEDAGALRTAEALLSAECIANVRLSRASAADSGLPADSLDFAVIRHVLIHNGPTASSIVEHVASRLKPGGRLLVTETDIIGWSHDRPVQPDIEDLFDRWAELIRQRGNDLRMGTHLRCVLESTGLRLVALRPRIESFPPGVVPIEWAARDAIIAAGLASEADVERWAGAVDEFLQSDITWFAPLYVAVAERPV
jgi:SAM-dependent methyltransferase